MNIGYDIDGVICNFGKALSEFLKTEFGAEVDLSQVEKYDDFAEIVRSYGIEVLDSFICSIGAVDAEPYEGVETINKRYNQGHKIYFITARTHEDNVLKWLYKNKIMYSDIFFTHSHNKYKIIKDLGLYTYIDDRIETLFSICDNKIPVVPVVRDHPWNRDPHDYLNIVRVNDLYEYDEFIEQVLEIHRLSID